LSDLTLLRSIALPPGPRGDEHQFSGEPRLLRTPLVRSGGRVAIGHAPEVWQAWVDAAKQDAGKPA